MEKSWRWGESESKCPALNESVIIARSLKQVAGELGFSSCRVACAAVASGAESYVKWISAGFHADMDWLARNPERRCDPRLVLDGCRSVIMLAFDYGVSERLRYSAIARYAQGSDYHAVIEAKLTDLDLFLQQYEGVQRCYVDSGPVLERDFASSCGVGWRGRNGLIVRESGSRFFLAAVLTTLELPPDDAVPVRCGNCSQCLQSCPTGALMGNGEMNASLCISYLTIENKGGIPEEMRELIGGRIYGCDACQDCCPWNRREQTGGDVAFKSSAELRGMPLRAFLDLDESDFLRLFRSSPIRRVKLTGLQRNVCVALGNVGVAEDVPALEAFLLKDTPFSDHAAWAIDKILKRLGGK